MGRRKERRLAALSNAGRRVKLDLFEEPSGDVAGISAHDEVRGDHDQNHRAGFAISPSSAGKCYSLGKRPENPLLLLGQYSDDEMDDKDNKDLEGAVSRSSSEDHNGQAYELVDTNGNMLHDKSEDFAHEDVDKPESFDKNLDAVKNNSTSDNGEGDIKQQNATEPTEQIDVSGTSCSQIVGDVSGGWKLVMHEQSNQYYYWNTVTGETSWEVPNVFAQEGETTGETKVFPTVAESKSHHVELPVSVSSINTPLDSCPNVPACDGPKITELINDADEKHEGGFEMESEGDLGRSIKPEVGSVVNHTELDNNLDLNPGPCKEAAELHDSVWTSTLVSRDEKSSTSEEQSLVTRSDEDIPARLLKYGERLLQRLKVQEGSNDRKLKHITEVEIRLSDCKVLSSYGPTLLPFWWHSETQLKQIESAIDEEVHFTKSEQLKSVEVGLSSSCGYDHVGVEPEVYGMDKVEKGRTSPMLKSPIHLDNEPETQILQKQNGKANPAHMILETEPLTSEDIDMDVDMEVDDETCPKNKFISHVLCSKQNAPSEPVSHLSKPDPPPNSLDSVEELSVPPPPDDEWIPPPPPDSELIPPPPPDEPPAPSYPSFPYSGTLHSLPYTEQYNFAYTGPTYQYYTPTMSEITNTNCYAPSDGSQIADPQSTSYYETVPNSFSEASLPVVTQVISAVYYDIQNGNVPPGPVNNLVSTTFYNEPGAVSYHGSATLHEASVGATTNSGSSELPSGNGEPEAKEPEMAAVDLPSIPSATFQATSDTLENEIVLTAQAVNAKSQPKVVRIKKRTLAVAPTLRSNKKVSSLVDKWKAAKDELHGDEEDEPEDAYEMLEKKKQREIKEWYAQQIASGEALDNANFQPLGGDWRERVKRKRSVSSQTTGKADKTPPATTLSNKQQPDLVELSKDLPSGWQAYWDESSKEIYFGNVFTSETTWTRPT